MKKNIIMALFVLFSYEIEAQESKTVYNFLRLPVSAHAAALGGENISIDDDDPTLVFHNPALASNVADRSLNLNYMTYMEGVKVASASFVKAFRERATWALEAQYVDYGTMKHTTVDNEVLGDVSAKDIDVGGTFTYTLSDKIAGGVTAKFVSSSLAGYNSIGVAVDLGVNYLNPDLGLSLSAVARNLGGQLKAYEDDFEKLPFDLQLGVSKRLGESPLRFSVTMTRLHDWDDKFINHFIFGAEAFLSDNIWLGGGINPRRSDDMKISDGESESSHGAGFSLGGGLQLDRFKLQVAYGKYHVSASSLIINVTYTI
jgi:hypothetical protein